MKDKLEYRMYGLVPYNLSPIQQGIQFGHAVVEYMLNFPVDLKIYSDTNKWAREDKTFIILNGGTTNTKGDHRLGHGGTLNQHLFKLSVMGIKVASFYEPDLGDQLTAVVFLVDERVFDKKKYPDFLEYCELQDRAFRMMWQSDQHTKWLEHIGGEQNVWMREFLKQFRLA